MQSIQFNKTRMNGQVAMQCGKRNKKSRAGQKSHKFRSKMQVKYRSITITNAMKLSNAHKY